jgi:hypothetical protein
MYDIKHYISDIEDIIGVLIDLSMLKINFDLFMTLNNILLILRTLSI